MWRLALFVLLVVARAHAAEISFPPLTGRVVDQAGILGAAAEAELSDKLAAHERATSQQVVVATVPALEGRAIEEYGVGLGRAWGIGEKGRNTGVILLVAPNDRQVRIEVGYGLEGQLTDALSRVIIERDILPRFRAGQMEAGIVAGVESILAVLRGEETARPQSAPPARAQDPGEIPLVLILILFFLFARFGRRRRRGLWPVVLGGPVIWHGGGRRGGGFRGGGGSFGGGGASGRW
ncbi:MAG: YgcG family protein [Rhodospirillaceae bacterium]